MSRPPSKRRRFYDQFPTSAIDQDDIFSTPSAAHIFGAASASASTSRYSPTPDELHPTSYEITLNHNAQLKRSLHPSSFCCADGERKEYGARLVTWTSSCGTREVTSDRYDAVHLLSELPEKPLICRVTNVDEDDRGWSDLDSDTEDLFYMTSDEAATFTHQKAKAAMEAQHTARLAQLDSPAPSPPPPTSTTAEDAMPPPLSKSQFELMQKTAKVVSSSTNVSLLELKILANHGGDPRFAFLRTDGGEQRRLGQIWKDLKARQGEVSYEEALKMCDDGGGRGQGAKSSSGGGLVAYGDSDSDSENESDIQPREKEAETTEATVAIPAADVIPAADEQDAALLKKQKQAERLARAKLWLQTRSSQPTSASASKPPI
ncbi:hypothetical protein EX895_003223 [Sporisorium graminicola]|uniref:SURP motif domain-containing protein n=1 Tax=Sporisorium graminicola TaxID=280036 RepID=A0A4U7KXT1_9BASI|nr:hypothetical protein EX895_003223 [Sporisorium graminicola]TKY87642.1 hypothetical protein EX895_003223 [Sporisorium graminicola]